MPLLRRCTIMAVPPIRLLLLPPRMLNQERLLFIILKTLIMPLRRLCMARAAQHPHRQSQRPVEANQEQ